MPRSASASSSEPFGLTSLGASIGDGTQKEVWALITFMIYAVALHTRSVPQLHRPTAFHVFMTLAFLTLVMTYFGVNYFLGGMHSYA